MVAVRWYENTERGKALGPEFLGRVKGEAPFVEVKPGVYLFATLGSAKQIALTSFDDDPAQYSSAARMAPVVEGQRATREVPAKAYPMLVTFSDIDDPKTVSLVDANDLDASFGCNRPSAEPKPWRNMKKTWRAWYLQEIEHITEKSSIPEKVRAVPRMPRRDTSRDCYRIRRITVEITDDEATEGQVERLLIWMSWSREKLLAAGGGRSPLQVSMGGGYLALDAAAFRGGIK